MRSMNIRPATLADAEGIALVYNQGIEDRVGTFETRPRSTQDIEGWFDGVHPIVVTEDESGIIAFGSTSTYRSRDCYAGIAEFSIYVRRDKRNQKIGYPTLQALIEAAEKAGFWKLVSRVFIENTPSLKLLASLGWREVGVYQKHAKLDDVWRDVVIVERLIESNL
jgi:L-amino acid N-acyltransferase YncA